MPVQLERLRRRDTGNQVQQSGNSAARGEDSNVLFALGLLQKTAEAALGEGLVKKIDKTKGTVTLAHGALPNGMPPMTMAYKVKDAAWLDKMTVGQKIRFATDPADGMTVSRFEPAK